MLTITTTRFFGISGDAIVQERVVRLFGWAIYRWQERQAPSRQY